MLEISVTEQVGNRENGDAKADDPHRAIAPERGEDRCTDDGVAQSSETAVQIGDAARGPVVCKPPYRRFQLEPSGVGVAGHC